MRRLLRLVNLRTDRVIRDVPDLRVMAYTASLPERLPYPRRTPAEVLADIDLTDLARIASAPLTPLEYR